MPRLKGSRYQQNLISPKHQLDFFVFLSLVPSWGNRLTEFWRDLVENLPRASLLLSGKVSLEMACDLQSRWGHCLNMDPTYQLPTPGSHKLPSLLQEMKYAASADSGGKQSFSSVIKTLFEVSNCSTVNGNWSVSNKNKIDEAAKTILSAAVKHFFFFLGWLEQKQIRAFI